MQTKICLLCGATEVQEYVLTRNASGMRVSPSATSAYLCSDDCADDYFDYLEAN